MNQSGKEQQQRRLYSAARGLVIISAVTAILVSLLIIINYVQITKADPLESPALVTLKNQLRDDPGNALLQEQIRELDLLARKSFFTNIWQLKSGGYIILASIILMLLSLKIAKAQERQLPDPTRKTMIPSYLSYSRKTQTVILVTGLIIVCGGLLFALLTPPALQNQVTDEMAGDMDSAVDLSIFWPEFRGLGGIATSQHLNIPRTWDGESGENILWKTPLPLKGFNSPIVVEDRLFLSGGNKNTREVYCFSTDTGELLWTRTVPNMLQPGDNFDFDYVDPNVGFAAPTMATDGKSVYAIFATGDVICYTIHGDQVWGRNLGSPDNHYAHSSSLIIHEGLCIIQYDNFKKPRLVALDCSNGAIEWEEKRKTISWASPIIVSNEGRKELIVADSETVAGYDPASGKKYWSSACLSGEVGPSPAYANGIVVVVNEYAAGTALRISEHASEPEIVWQIEDNLPNTASPAMNDKYVLLATSSGLVTLIDVNTGDFIWEDYLGDGFYSSPILVGSDFYLTDLSGKTFIVTPAETLQVSAENSLGEEVSSTPAFVDGKIYFRTNKHLYCISEAGE